MIGYLPRDGAGGAFGGTIPTAVETAEGERGTN